MELVSYTNQRVTVRLINKGHVPVVCHGVGTTWMVEEAPTYPMARRSGAIYSPSFTLEGGTKRQIVAVPWWVGDVITFDDPSPPKPERPAGRFDVQCDPIHGKIRERLEMLLRRVGIAFTTRCVIVTVAMPPEP